jgi:hypothetical protein
MAIAPKHLYHLRVVTLKKIAGSARFQGAGPIGAPCPETRHALKRADPTCYSPIIN